MRVIDIFIVIFIVVVFVVVVVVVMMENLALWPPRCVVITLSACVVIILALCVVIASSLCVIIIVLMCGYHFNQHDYMYLSLNDEHNHTLVQNYLHFGSTYMKNTLMAI